jgi:hypothetical protein
MDHASKTGLLESVLIINKIIQRVWKDKVANIDCKAKEKFMFIS